MRRTRQCNFFTQWNYYAPFVWFWIWLKPYRKRICKFLLKCSAITIGIYLSIPASNFMTQVFAAYDQFVEQKKLDELELEAAYKLAEQRMAEAKEKEMLRKEQYVNGIKQRELDRIQEVENEIKSQYQVGNYIIITWWGDLEYGPDHPPGMSSAGQIRKIKGEYVYGTWGDFPLKYNHCYWHNCKLEELQDIRDKELKKSLKALGKSKHKSWGRYPGL